MDTPKTKPLNLHDVKREDDGSLTMIGKGPDGELVEFRGCTLISYDIEVSFDVTLGEDGTRATLELLPPEGSL